ncbi:MAG: hypothetical protein ACRCVA_22600 [Phreatobacter sp.]
MAISPVSGGGKVKMAPAAGNGIGCSLKRDQGMSRENANLNSGRMVFDLAVADGLPVSLPCPVQPPK